MPATATRQVRSVLPELERHLARVQAPAQYTGGEVNMVRKDPAAADVRVALVFPDVYQVGMSHLGLKILYGLLNELPWAYAERAFAPWPDLEERMRAEGIPAFTLETHSPLADFDLVGFSLQYEMSYTTVLNLLDLGGIPVRQEDRGPDHPVVAAGGPIIFNAEPLAPFLDLMVIGDGEEAAAELARLLRELKPLGLPRHTLLRRLAGAIPGLYVPSLYETAYDDSGILTATTPACPEAPATVPQTFIPDLDAAYFPTAPVLPNVRIVHDRMEIEIMRGCTQGCRFCHAGYTKRPVRHRWPETIDALAEQLYRNTGYDEIALTSLSSADYPFLRDAVSLLNNRFNERRVGLTLPSLRVNERSRDIPGMVGQVRKSGLTFAPEAASETLRRRINKNISDEDLLAGCRTAWEDGWSSIKLYFLIGIPDETDDDVLAILDLAERVSALRRECGYRKAGTVNAAVSTFVPKAHTPYQWDPMISRGEIDRKKLLLRLNNNNRNIRLKFHTTEVSFVEGVLSRGDRRMGEAVYQAWRRGARLEAWDEHFDLDTWHRAFRAADIDPAWYVYRQRDAGEVFPWEVIAPGVTRRYLWIERQRARTQSFTSECRDDRCHGCGVDVTACFM